MKQLIITGKPGAGKTTLLNLLGEQGFKIISCDKIVEDLYKFNRQGFKVIKKYLGNKFINNNGVNKKALWEAIKNHEIKINDLNKLIHPLIYQQLQIVQFDFCECPIIGSPFLDHKKFTILKLDVDDKIAINRLMKRKKINKIEAKQLINLFQNNIKVKATFNTNNNINDLFVKKVINFYQSL